MNNHEELVREMHKLEFLSPRERLRRAKVKREAQLKRWNQFENTKNKEKLFKEFSGHFRKISINGLSSSKQKRVKFEDYACLFDAISQRDLAEVKRLLNAGINTNACNQDGITSLHQCCINNLIDILQLLIKFGADVNKCDNDLWTPLHAAATCGYIDACRLLIQSNANLLSLNNDGNMPYDLCDDSKCLEFIELQMASKGITQEIIDRTRNEIEETLLGDIKNTQKRDINRKFREQNGCTLLHIASSNGYLKVLHELLNKGACINATDNDGWTPLHLATYWNHFKAIDILISHNADLFARTNENESILDLCDNEVIRELIIEKTNRNLNEINLRADKPNRESKVLSLRRSMSSEKDVCKRIDVNFEDVLYNSQSSTCTSSSSSCELDSNDFVTHL
jgi:ankyrin repeat protein